MSMMEGVFWVGAIVTALVVGGALCIAVLAYS